MCVQRGATLVWNADAVLLFGAVGECMVCLPCVSLFSSRPRLIPPQVDTHLIPEMDLKFFRVSYSILSDVFVVQNVDQILTAD